MQRHLKTNDKSKDKAADESDTSGLAAKNDLLQQKLDKKSFLLAKSEERELQLEARHEDVAHMLKGLREEKVYLHTCTVPKKGIHKLCCICIA